jgi:dimethylhistidine N-methyltransferase
MSIDRHPQPRFIQRHHADDDAVRDEIQAGLLSRAAHVAPKFFYDALGSRLFDAITELPEYYPTRTEAAIFRRHGRAMAEAIGPQSTLIDLGAGNCEKAERLFPLLRPAQYIAVDISVDYLRDALNRVQRANPALPITGLGLDFSSELELPAELPSPKPVYFYPGSSIGNFAPSQAARLLSAIRARSDGGGLLIGVDLVKPVARLNAAYDDALGVTAAFNRNMLRHLNRLIGSDFDPAAWRHVAFFNTGASRIEMHLEAIVDLSVRWPGHERRFARGERILTEYSHKYTPQSFSALLTEAGFGRQQHWTDDGGDFAVFWAHA